MADEPKKAFFVKALEKFNVVTTYQRVEADSAEEAVELCKTGQWPYDEHSISEGGDEWIEVLNVEEHPC